MGAQMKVEAETYDAGDLADAYSEMLERNKSVDYMLQVLQSEITLLPELTGLDKIYFQSITRCFGVLEQLSYDNMQRIASSEEKFEEQFKKGYKALK